VNIFSLVMRLADPFRNLMNRKDEAGAALVEYALLLALIAVVALGALAFLGHNVTSTISSVGSSIG